MTNVLVEKVKELTDDLKDIVYQCTGGRIVSGTEQLFIALLEADLGRLKKNKCCQLCGQMSLCCEECGQYDEWCRDIQCGCHKYQDNEITYKQQAIDELKNLN